MWFLGRMLWVLVATLSMWPEYLLRITPRQRPLLSLLRESVQSSSRALRDYSTTQSPLAVTTYIFMFLGLAGGADVSPLLWQSQYIAMARTLPGYSKNQSEYAPDEDGCVTPKIYTTKFAAHFNVFALDLDHQARICQGPLRVSLADASDSSAITPSPSPSSASSAANATARRLRGYDIGGGVSAPPALRACQTHARFFASLEDHNAWRTATFLNRIIGWAIGLVVAGILTAATFFATKQRWTSAIEGTDDPKHSLQTPGMSGSHPQRSCGYTWPMLAGCRWRMPLASPCRPGTED